MVVGQLWGIITIDSNNSVMNSLNVGLRYSPASHENVKVGNHKLGACGLIRLNTGKLTRSRHNKD